MENDSNERGYEIGYGKPPCHTRFQKGRSGNPKGRRRGSKNQATLLMEALHEPVIISENGHRKKITKQQVIIKQIVNKAASGDHRSIQLLLANQIPAIEAQLESAPSKPTILDLLRIVDPILRAVPDTQASLAKEEKMIDQPLPIKPDAPPS